MTPRRQSKRALRQVARALALAAAATLLGGCAVVQSQHASHALLRQGVPYMLPKALLPVQLVEADGVLMLRVLPAQTVGDPAHSYLLAPSRNAFASDDVTIEVDPATGLLKQVTATADDQTLAVLSELVKASRIRRAESGGGSAETLLFSGLYDPDGGDLVASPNARLHIGLQQALLARIDARAGLCAEGAPDSDCRQARSLQATLQAALAPGAAAEAAVVVVKAGVLGVETTPSDRPVSASVPASAPVAAARAPTAPPAPTAAASATAATAALAAAADCSVGICHRALRPFLVELSIRGVFAQSTVVMLPNGGDPVALALDRAPFVKTEHTVVLSDGQLQSVHSKRPSSALALVKWPLEVYQAALEATATLITLRIGANTNEVALAQSQLDTAKELKRLAGELATVKAEGGTPPPGPTRLGGPQRGNALIAVELGQRPTLASKLLPDSITPPTGPGTLPGQPR